MTSVNSVNSASQLNKTASELGSRVPQKNLGQGDFLKLLAKQFQTQDPMKPMEDTAFIAQMAQFTSLEQSKSMSEEMTAMRTDQQRTAANSYLGHRVTVSDGKGGTETGDVLAVNSSSGDPTLVINGKPFALSAVILVEPAQPVAPKTNS